MCECMCVCVCVCVGGGECCHLWGCGACPIEIRTCEIGKKGHCKKKEKKGGGAPPPPCQIIQRLDSSCEIFHEPRMQVVLQPLVS